MAVRPPDTVGRTGRKTIVRLTDVPAHTRRVVANRIIRVEGLVGVPALDLLLAAEAPVQDPWLIVDAEAARKVCGR